MMYACQILLENRLSINTVCMTYSIRLEYLNNTKYDINFK